MPVPDQIKVFPGEQMPAVACPSLEELEAFLRGIHQRCDPDYPVYAVVSIPGFDLCMGLGAASTFAEIHVEPYDGESYTTRGDPSRTGEKEFRGCGGLTRRGEKTLVPFEDALAALLEFVAHQRRSERVHWEG